MALLNDKDRTAVQEQLREVIQTPVQLALFVDQNNCEYCDVTRELLTEVVNLHDDLQLTVYDMQADADRATELQVNKAPAIVVLGGAEGTNYGIRYYGIPSGYEFATLLESIRIVGGGSGDLQPATQSYLNDLTTPVHFQVFVTPSCPHCPRAAVLAHRMAYAHPNITADVVEVTEFPELGDQYAVMGVPLTVIEEEVRVEGAAPEPMVLARLKEAVQARMSQRSA